jgi:hypothetical protein
MSGEGLDAEKIGTLSRWAEGLRHDDRAEVAAAGRAILMLVDEVERLHVLLWDRRLNGENAVTEAPASEETEPEVPESPPELEASLRSRLRARWRRAPREGTDDDIVDVDNLLKS